MTKWKNMRKMKKSKWMKKKTNKKIYRKINMMMDKRILKIYYNNNRNWKKKVKMKISLNMPMNRIRNLITLSNRKGN
jgi:hypothetical protein